MANLGEVLKSRREELRFTLRDAEKLTGLSNAYLSQLENGKISQPAPSVLSKLAKSYELSYHRLMQLAGHPLESDSDRKTVVFKRIGATEELSKEEEKELLRYLGFIRSRRS